MTAVVVLVVDRWGAAWCGPYGNTFVETPSLNRLAGQSLLFDWVVAESPLLPSLYQALWTGRHPLQSQDEPAVLLPDRAAGPSCLLSDAPEVLHLSGSETFHRLVGLDTPPVERLAGALEDTGLAALFAEASRLIRGRDAPFLLWVHAQGMQADWDAPWAWRLRFREDDEDPEPSRSPRPTQRRLHADDDPDLVFGAVQCYAAQVELADACLGGLLDQLDGIADPPWLVFLSPRGYPLGEHGRIGPCDQALYGELLHVPLMVRPPRGCAPGGRCGDLLQVSDLGAWLRLVVARPDGALPDTPHPQPGCWPQGRPWALASGPDQQFALRTAAWFVRLWGDKQLELYVKPDDRFEANELSRRCPEVADTMRRAIDDLSRTMESGGQPILPQELGET